VQGRVPPAKVVWSQRTKHSLKLEVAVPLSSPTPPTAVTSVAHRSWYATPPESTNFFLPSAGQATGNAVAVPPVATEVEVLENEVEVLETVMLPLELTSTAKTLPAVPALAVCGNCFM
jgi:hypothetical protein